MPAGPPRENLKTDQKNNRKVRLLASDRSRILGFARGRAGARALSLVLAHGGSFERKRTIVGKGTEPWELSLSESRRMWNGRARSPS